MPRSLGRKPIGFSQRSGAKVRASDLVEDGEIRGLVVARGEVDREHPQKYARRVPADRLMLRRPLPDPVQGACTIRYGWEAASNLWEGRQQPFSLTFVMGRVLVTSDEGEVVV